MSIHNNRSRPRIRKFLGYQIAIVRELLCKSDVCVRSVFDQKATENGIEISRIVDSVKIICCLFVCLFVCVHHSKN